MFKVVSIVDGNFVSYVADGEAEVTYRLNKWSIAPGYLAAMGYHLTVFENMYFALQFTKRIHLDFDTTWALMKVDACREVALPKRCDLASIQKSGSFFSASVRWPAGTRMFKLVKPIKVMSYEDVQAAL